MKIKLKVSLVDASNGEFHWDCVEELSHWMQLVKRGPDQEVIGHYRFKSSFNRWVAYLSVKMACGSVRPDRICATEDEARDFIERSIPGVV